MTVGLRLLALLLLTAYTNGLTLYYVYDSWRYTIVLDKENSSISGVYCADCREDGYECEELPPDIDDPSTPIGPLQPGLITIIALTSVLFVLMLLTVTAVITYRYIVNRHRTAATRQLMTYG